MNRNPEQQPCLLQELDAFFIAIAPLPLSLHEWLHWRQKALAAPPREGLAIGQGIVAESAMTLIDKDVPWPVALEAIVQRSRRFPGAIVPLPGLQSLFMDFATRLELDPARATTAAWLLASSEAGPALLFGCGCRGARPTQTAVMEALRQAIRSVDERTLGGLLRGDAPLWLGPVTQPDLRENRCHLVSVYRDSAFADAPKIDPENLRVHNTEEANVENSARDYLFDRSTLRYAHVGFSYTTFAATQIVDALYLLPSVAVAQLTWALQRQVEETLQLRSWNDRDGSDTSAAAQLEILESVKLELKLAALGRQAFREGLLPWQGRCFERYVRDWNLDASSVLIEATTDHIARYLDAQLRVQTLNANKRQSAWLNVIAILGVASTVAAYKDLLHEVHWVRVLCEQPLYPYAVAVLFVATVVLISAVFLRHSDAKAGSLPRRR